MADYGTIRTAFAVRDDALLHQRDWRRKSFAASLAARNLLTVRIATGTCAAYITELYGSLRDLMELLIVDPQARTVSWLGLEAGDYQHLQRGRLIELGADEL